MNSNDTQAIKTAINEVLRRHDHRQDVHDLDVELFVQLIAQHDTALLEDIKNMLPPDLRVKEDAPAQIHAHADGWSDYRKAAIRIVEVRTFIATYGTNPSSEIWITKDLPSVIKHGKDQSKSEETE